MATADEIRAFASRDWARIERSKRSHWAGLTPTERVGLAAVLWTHARETIPGWPDASQRGADLAHHVELGRKLAAIAHAFPRR